MNQTLNFIRNESGTTALEYCFIVALIAIGIVAAVISIGNTVSNCFVRVLPAFP